MHTADDPVFQTSFCLLVNQSDNFSTVCPGNFVQVHGSLL